MEPFLGEIKLFAGTFAPQGWSMCDGHLLSISENDALFALIGTTYGGDGVSTFAVPDMRGRVPLHQGTGAGLSSYTLGEVGGAENVTLVTPNLPAHTHVMLVSTSAGKSNAPAGGVLAVADASCQVYRETTGTVAFNAGTIAPSNGGNSSHENRQPFQAINYIIALNGIWPQQN